MKKLTPLSEEPSIRRAEYGLERDVIAALVLLGLLPVGLLGPVAAVLGAGAGGGVAEELFPEALGRGLLGRGRLSQGPLLAFLGQLQLELGLKKN